MFLQTGLTVFTAIFQLFLISFAAGIMVRRKFISQEQVQALSGITVNVFLPCLIIAKTLMRFRPEELPQWWILPLAGVLIAVTGLIYSGILFRLKPDKNPQIALASLQNGIYLPLPVGQILFPEQFDLFALYCFLLIMGLNTMMWSLGAVMLGQRQSKIRLRDFITPPLASVFFSVFAVLTGLSDFIPGTLVASIDMLGQATVPAAVFVLGATMGAISLKEWPPIGDIFKVFLVKFILVPATVFGALFFSDIRIAMPLACSMLIIQGSSPPATNLILIAKAYGGDTRQISAMMLVQYLACILMMPLWIAVWQYVTR
ncbi:MAG TPA: permease [Desulfobacteraceae bacterium]|nr:permease [Desulfobacteraceae bacterium]